MPKELTNAARLGYLLDYLFKKFFHVLFATKATEMAARGIDAPYLTHVINLDLPTDGSHYAHRVGRAGRGGRPGVVINLTCDIKERKVPHRFANELGFPLHTVVARGGKLVIVDDEK